MHIPLLYIPSFYGDIKLEAIREGKKNATRIIVEKATPGEQEAMVKLAAYAAKKSWVSSADHVKLDGVSVIDAPMLKVQEKLTSLLKPGRKTLTAVRFVDGGMEEVSSTPLAPALEPPSKPVSPGGIVAKAKEAVATAAAEVKAAVTVAKPYQGCPAPDFEAAELKAEKVLEVFLDDDQIEDFREHNRFISVGALTGHNYMVTSRYARGALAKFQRTLFDLDDDTPFCVHDWNVPAAEEMLAIHAMLSLPQHEGYLRCLPEEEG